MFLSALIVALVSLFLPTFVSAFVYPDYKRGLVIGAIAGTVGYTAILSLIFWLSQLGVYGPFPFWPWILLGGIISAILTGKIGDGWSTTVISWIVFGIAFLYLMIILIFQQSSMIHSMEQAELIGEVEIIEESEGAIEPADNVHICLVPQEVAYTNVQNALSKVVLKDGAVPGSRYKVKNNPTKQFVDGSYWWIFPLEFRGYFKWKQDPQVPGYLRVSAENPLEQPQAVQTDVNGNEIHIKYLKSAHLGNKAKRYLRNNGYFYNILVDWTFEVDDEWRPYYTVSVVERQLGFRGYVVKGLILFDVQTGEIVFYKVDEVPDWVDHVIPKDEVINYNTTKWGLYSKSSWWDRAFRGSMSQKPTPGWYMTYSGDHCQWFSGFTSIRDDSALTGFMLVDSRTGEAVFYKSSGMTENLAYDAARTLWNNFSEYEPTDLVLYNIYGRLTYVIPMKCKNQFTGVSLVALNNNAIRAKGDTLQQALSSYLQAIAESDKNGLTAQSGETQLVSLTGVVEYVAPPIGSDTLTFSFKLKDVGKVFQVVYSDANPKVIFIDVGQTVTLVYMETTTVVVSVTEFDIPSIVLEEGSVDQARYIESQNNIDEEVDRITDQEKRDSLINSDEMKDVDPEALEEFLAQQAEQDGN